MKTITLEEIKMLGFDNSLVFTAIGVGDTFVGDELLQFVRENFPKEHLKFRMSTMEFGDNIPMKADDNNHIYISAVKEFSNQALENPDQILNHVEEVLDYCQSHGIDTVISNQLVHIRDNFTEQEVMDEIDKMLNDYQGITWYYHKED